MYFSTASHSNCCRDIFIHTRLILLKYIFNFLLPAGNITDGLLLDSLIKPKTLEDMSLSNTITFTNEL